MSALETVTKRKQPLLVALTAAWHLLLSLGLLGGAAWVALGRVDVVQGTLRGIIAAVAAVLAAVQLYFLPALWQRQPRGRVMSLAVNYVGLGYSAFFTFRNATVTAALGHSYTPAERQAAAAAVLPVVIAFGFFAWAMWNRRTAQEFNETTAQREALTAYVYISPYLFLASIFTVTMLTYALWLSLHQSAIFDVPTYVGLANYAEALKDKDFHRALYNVVWYVVFVVTLQTSFAILLAVILNAKFRGRGLFRTMFYAPSVTSSIVISLIFLWLYQKTGFLNYFFTRAGLNRLFLAAGIKAQPNWLNTATGFLEIFLKPFVENPKALPWWQRGPSIAWVAIMAMNIFTTAPTFMIMFLAALQDIPIPLYEAAEIDGASKWRQFWSVTLPLLRPVILLVVVLGTIGTFQVFDQAFIMTAGGPLDTTLTPVLLIYQKVLGSERTARAGYASAMAFLLGAIIFFFTFIQRRYVERGTEMY
jgi:multiple sugar transport system permease protein